jgi:hypothetical protein
MEQQSAVFNNDAPPVSKLLRDEETHYDRFSRQIDLIQRFGPAYLALQSVGAESAAATSRTA